MAHLLRGKQAGIQNDLSAGISQDNFNVDDIARFGLNSQVSAIAYDPVQSLLALGTKETKFGNGQIYIFGQQRVTAIFHLSRQSSVRILQFCADKLLCLDAKNQLSVYSLETEKLVSTFSAPSSVTAFHSDPTLDYVLIGLQTGETIAFDIDRECAAPFRIPNLWQELNPRIRYLPVVSLAFHPRDIGTLLIGYAEGAVIYSFKQNQTVKHFHYHLPRGAPGGDSDPASVNVSRSPKLTQALWHPTGTFILTGHEDGSLVFWDTKDGRIIMARTLQDTNVNKPGSGRSSLGVSPGTFAVKEPIFRIAWCANQDPDDTGILVAGGAPTNLPTKGLTFLELGRTPVYATSSWQVLSGHFESPRRQRILPTPPNAEVVDFCLIPKASPHFAGAQDPIAILALLSSGEIATLSFSSGIPITPSNQLHVSMTFNHPFTTYAGLTPVERSKWLGMREKRSHGPPILKGGAEGKYPMKRFENRNIVQAVHADGIVRLWDAGHGDEIENGSVVEVDVPSAIGRLDHVQVTQTALSGATGELAVGLASGEVAIFRWGTNKNPTREPPSAASNEPRRLTNISNRKDPTLSEGLFPLTLLDEQSGSVTALCMSDVGFVAAGFEGGSVAVIDLRGPAVIYRASVQDFAKQDRRGSFRRSSSQNIQKADWPVVIEFSVMTLDGDEYSSILMHVGTALGNLATFKVLPESTGGYKVEFVGSVYLDDKVILIAPVNATSGQPAYASQSAVGNLRNGVKVNGVLLAVTQSGVRLFKPAASKGAQKSWDEFLCYSASVTRFEDMGHALVGLFGDGYVRAYSIPGLKEIGAVRTDKFFLPQRLSEAVITSSGDIIGWKGPAEMALVNVWGSGLDLVRPKDVLWNPDLAIPPRPTISNFQWVSGTQHVTIADMDLLIGGPDRPPSKRMIQQAQSDAQSQGPSSSSGQQEEGYWAYMQRQINERTERLGLTNDAMENLENNSASFADDVSKFVQRQKRGAVKGAIKSKFGF